MTDIYVSGTAEWAQVKRPNKFGNWSINVYADKATRKSLKELGLRANPKEGNEEYGDGWFLTFRRPTSAMWKGVQTDLAPPKVVLADGTEFDGLIGNGSKVTVKLEVYEYKGGTDAKGLSYEGGKAARLVSVRIDELVEYVANSENETGTATMPSALAAGGLPF